MPSAIVTGGASGIGRATCELLLRDGWQVAIADRDFTGAQEAARALGGIPLAVDVSDEASVAAMVEAALGEFGGTLDGLATPAGIADTTPFMEIDRGTFDRVYAINVLGTFFCVREAAKRMKPGARICTVASVAGKRGGGLSGTAAYAASKGAVLALSRNAARALAPLGIAVNCVAPGATETPMVAKSFENREHRERVESLTLLGRSAQPDEIAEAIAWLLSPRSSFVDGETLTVDGGLMLD